MSKNKELKKAYRDLQIQEAPDLWNRIEANLSPKAVGEEPRIIHAAEKKKKKNYRATAGLATAACCALLVFGGMAGREQMKSDIAGVAGNIEEAGMMAEETRTEGSGEEVTLAAAYPGDSITVSYDSLGLQGNKPPAPPENAVYVPGDHFYFTESDLKNAGLLSQVTVQAVSYESGRDSQADCVVYDVVTDKVLYSEDYVNEGQTLQVKSPLVGNGEENSLLYLLKEGGTYILPLKYENSAYWLVYPNSPQIEVTKDTKYVFHTGWQSLVKDQTAVVLKHAESPEDYYYDRIVMRNDPVFLIDLTVLMETVHRSEEKL